MKLNNIPLELDDRIYDVTDIKTVITADENDVGKLGYFANSIHYFKNLKGLNGIKYGRLIYLSNLDYGGDKSDKCFVCSNHNAYRYFIPEDHIMPVEDLKEILRQKKSENNKSTEDKELEQDYLDFCKIFFGCSDFDSRGNFQPGKWSKLDKIEFPFSEERKNYLIMKFVFGITDSKDNPRVLE